MHIGIDCGLTGAIAVLPTDGALVALCDTPTLRLKVARGTKHAFDCPGLVSLLAPYADPQTHVIIEEAQAMPVQGTRSMCMIGGIRPLVGHSGRPSAAHRNCPASLAG